MEKELPNRKTLIKYLLGELSEAERLEIAERYFTDDDWFDELLEVENELLDQYARGSLNEKERESFKRYLESLPDGRQKAAVAQAFAQISDAEKAHAQQILNEYAPAPVSVWQSRLQSLWQPLRWRQYIVIASFVVIGIGLLLLFSQLKQLRNDREQLRAQIANLEKENASLEQSASGSLGDASSERLKQLEEQLQLEQQANEAQAQQLASLQPAAPVIVSWALTSALRSTGSPDQVRLPHSAKVVSITMPIERVEPGLSYRAIIQTTTGEQRREQAGLRANKTGTAVSLKLRADYFNETSYKLTLVGKDKDAVEMARDYYFTVARR